jgi:hypothetical protein
MNTNSAKIEMAVSDSSFIAFVFSLAGFALVEAWLLILGAGFPAHGIALVLGLPPGFMAIRGTWRDRNDLRFSDTAAAGPRRGFNTFNLVSAALLIAAGAVLGLLILYAQAFPLVIGAASLTFVPWSRISFYRRHFIAACMSIWIGIASVLAIGHQIIDVIFLPLACWVLWAFACVGLLRRAEHLWRAGRSVRSSVRVLQAWPAPEPLATARIAMKHGNSSHPSNTGGVKPNDDPMG